MEEDENPAGGAPQVPETDTAAVEGAPAPVAPEQADGAGAPESDGDNGDGDSADAERIAALESQLDALQAENAALTAERDALANERNALQAGADAANKAARASAGKGVKARKAGPIKPDAVLGLDALREVIAEADTVELVFSNGKTEIDGLPPLLIAGDAWGVSVGGLALRIPNLCLHPQVHCEIAGYALFVNGRQAAYAPRFEVLRIPPGQTDRKSVV